MAFHELGHYVDYHASSGMMHQDYDSVAECCLDTGDEGSLVKELVLQLFAMWARVEARRGLLDYCNGGAGVLDTLDGLAGDFDGVGILGCGGFDESDAFAVSADAARRIGSFEYDCHDVGAPVLRDGYRFPAFFQAFWELLHARECSWSGAAWSCESVIRDEMDEPVEPDVRWFDPLMQAMLYALKQGNSPSFVGFWREMQSYMLIHHGPPDVDECVQFDLITHVMDLHGITELVPDATCNDDNGYCIVSVSPKRGRTPAESGRVWWNDASARTPAIPTGWTKRRAMSPGWVPGGQCHARYALELAPCEGR